MSAIHIENMNAAIASLHAMANHPEFSGKVVNVPVRKALTQFKAEIIKRTPRQTPQAAARMRRYPRFASFPRLYQRVGSRFRGARGKKAAVGASGFNVTFRSDPAPHSYWNALGTKDRYTKAVPRTGRVRGVPGYRGKMTAFQVVPSAISAIGPNVLRTMENEVKDRFTREAQSMTGSPFRKS